MLSVGSPILGLNKSGMRRKNVPQGHALILFHYNQFAFFFLYEKKNKYSRVNGPTDTRSLKWLTCLMSLLVGRSFPSVLLRAYLLHIKINLLALVHRGVDDSFQWSWSNY